MVRLADKMGVGWFLQATAALMAGEGNVESALDWLFNQGDRDAAVASILSTNSAKETAPGTSFLLVAFEVLRK